ncbi:MAG TPA: sigma-70 family RNA polymerase sigma factor [Pirellulales bacterium]
MPEPGSGILDDVALDHAGLDEAGSSELLPVGLSGDGSAGEFTDDGDDERLLRLARDGDRGSFERLFSRYREDLRRVVAWRTDPRLRARVDPSDVVQDAQLEAFRRLDDFLRRRPMGFRLWLRKTAQEQLAKAFRRHVGTQMRSAGRETSLNDSESPGIGAIAAAADTPSQHMAAQEAAQAVWEGLAELAEHDREILIMRNYEGLNYDEICVVLDIEPAAARKRYGRALLRLRQRLAARGLTEEESQ